MNRGYSNNRKERDLFDRRSVRVGLFAIIPAIVFVLVSTAIRVSQYGIDHTIIVLGQQVLVPGGPSAMRVVLISDDGGYFLPTALTGHLVRGEDRHLLFDGAVSDSGYALARNFTLPDIPPGPAVLALDIAFDNRRRVVRSPIEIVQTSPHETLVMPEDAVQTSDAVRVVKDDQYFEAFTMDRGAPTGLTSVLFLRSTDAAGRPISTRFEVEMGQHSDEKIQAQAIQTDRLGLYARPVKPLALALPIRVLGSQTVEKDNTAGDAGVRDKQDGRLFPKVIYGGISATVHTPIVPVGERLKVTVRQLSSGGPVYADIFQDGRWVQAHSGWFQGASTKMEIAPAVSGLCRLQITTSAFAPGRTVAVQHFYVLKQGETLDQGLRDILAAVAEIDGHQAWARDVSLRPLELGAGYDRRMAAAFALSRLYAGHGKIPRLVSSRREDDAELTAFKRTFQRRIMIAILLIGFGVTALIALIAVQAHRRQQRLTSMILSDADTAWEATESPLIDPNEPPGKYRIVIQGAILFFIIMGAFVAVALLVDTLTWHR
ncbi:MAG: hypothetical protein QNJ97_06260 [Myxococcota bacterium]|nr:hypothetical protein [Myxococcota bacterium]